MSLKLYVFIINVKLFLFIQIYNITCIYILKKCEIRVIRVLLAVINVSKVRPGKSVRNSMNQFCYFDLFICMNEYLKLLWR